MRRLNFWLTMAILAGLLLAAPALAATTIKQTIINNSGYPDNQVYLVFYGKLNSEIGTTAVGTFHRLDWPTGNFPAMKATDNTTDFSKHVPVPDPILYADYSIALDKLARDPISGQRFFNLPTVTDTTKGFYSGRLYVSFLNPVYIRVTDPKNISQPAYNPIARDVNTVLKTVYDFFEPAIDKDLKVWADTTNVDAVGMPLLYELRNGATLLGGPKGLALPLLTVRGAFLRDPVLKDLVLSTMIIAPGHAIENGKISSTYIDKFTKYITHCWGVWTSTHKLSITYDGVNWTGFVSSDILTLSGTVNSATETHTIKHPTPKDVFECNGAFDAGTPPNPEPDGWTSRDKDLKNQVGSALNRTVMHLDPYPNGQTDFPWQAYLAGYNKNVFYGQNGLTAAQFATNIYSKLLHQLCYDGVNIYGFAYDDNCNISTTITGYGDNLILTIRDCTGLPTPYVNLNLLLD